MEFGDAVDIEGVVIPEFNKFVEIDPNIKSFETELKRRYERY